MKKLKLLIDKFPKITFVDDHYEGVYINGSDEIKIGIESKDNCYTMIHELCHSTSHKDKLDRPLETVTIFEHFMGKYKSQYCLEEINCEIATYILLNYLGELTVSRQVRVTNSIKDWVDKFNKRSIAQYYTPDSKLIKDIVSFYVNDIHDKILTDSFNSVVNNITKLIYS